MHESNLNKIAVMNFANPYCPGGPYEKGKVTQETCIVSQTLLIGSLLTSSARPFFGDKYLFINNIFYNNKCIINNISIIII